MNDRHERIIRAAGVDASTIRPNYVGIACLVLVAFDDDLEDEWCVPTAGLAAAQARALRAAEPDPRLVIIVREVHCGGPEGIVPTGYEQRF